MAYSNQARFHMNVLWNPDCSSTQLALARDEKKESYNLEVCVHAQAIPRGTLKCSDKN